MSVETNPRVHRIAKAQGGVVLRRQAWECGLSSEQIRWLVRTGRWLPLQHGALLVDAHRRATGSGPPLLAALWAAHLRCGPRSVIGLGSAARLYGLPGLAPQMPRVDVVLPRGRLAVPDPRIRVHLADLLPQDVVRVGEGRLPVTSPVRPLTDLLLAAPPPQALGLLDAALHRGLLIARDLPLIERALALRPGGSAARSLLPLADGRAASPLESRARLDCVRGGVTPDHLQHRLTTPFGRLLTRADLCWTRGLRRPLVAHADGHEVHTLPSGPATPYAVLHFSWADAIRPGRIAGFVSDALERLRE
jgi:hypothetical protein